MWLYHAQLLVSVLVLAKKLIYFFVCSWLWLATKHQMTLCSAVVALVLVAVFYITWLWRPWSFCILYHMANATDDVEQLPFVALAKWNKIHLGPWSFCILYHVALETVEYIFGNCVLFQQTGQILCRWSQLSVAVGKPQHCRQPKELGLEATFATWSPIDLDVGSLAG